MQQQFRGPRRLKRKKRPAGSSSSADTTRTQGPIPEAPRNAWHAEPLSNGAVKWTALGQTVYVRDATKHPPGASYTVALLVGLACIFAIFWQGFTTFNAFSNMIFDGKIWLALDLSAQNIGRPVVNVSCLLIAVGFQAPLLFIGFKIDKRWATERHRQLSLAAKVNMLYHLTGELLAGNLLLSLWAILALVADTLGDVSFVNALTDNSVFLFFYAISLYGLSTVGLSECLQLVWDGMVTSEWLKHVRNANQWAEMNIRAAEEALRKRNPAFKGAPAKGAQA